MKTVHRTIADEAREVRPLVEGLLRERREKSIMCPGLLGFRPIEIWEGMDNIVAVDGGNRSRDYREFTIYLARAWAGGGGREALLHSLGVVVPPSDAEARISIYREILEAVVAKEAVPGGGRGLLLLDGSPSTALKWWRPGLSRWGLKMSAAISEAEKMLPSIRGQTLIPDCVEGGCVETLLEKATRRPASNRAAMILATLTDNIEQLRWIVAVEVAEKLYMYKTMLEEAWARGYTPVFVAKTSRSTEICRGPIADAAYIEARAPQSPSYAVAREDLMVKVGLNNMLGIEVGEGDGRFIPDVAGLRKFYENLAEVSTYARLAPGGPILRVSILLPGGDKKLGDHLGLLESILSRLANFSPSGYPVPLLIAHEKARVSGDDLERASLLLGLSLKEVSRGVLRI
ncbi:5' to 3' nuclease repair protein NurA [Aeropyrum pernix K1]|uniref:5' to 3' nuclease repair protein NurA n=1 Tax=Aeropyrum pernix (strain ATCC 700893 / DSM 11879 / JCM 9820 / NBRC 100138 / K1) TaxID=272557 RepID=Q9YFZ2_AERPE|nr:DNA double-strand break repair nuclease NurA [Aeropyrum pernix]BAA79019.2 5' to 3' nuclease repair protein NurA [Aeropyrum pernix K1]